MKMSQLLLEIRKIVREEIQLSLSESNTPVKSVSKSSNKQTEVRKPVKKVNESLDSKLSSLSNILGRPSKTSAKPTNTSKVYSKDPVFNDLLSQTVSLNESFSYNNDEEYEDMPYNKNAASYAHVSLNENVPSVGGASILDSEYGELPFLKKDYSKIMDVINSKKGM